MPVWCLPKHLTAKLRQDILDGTINPERLSKMSSKERRDFFAERLGEENAEPINKQFETKMILKHQQQGFITWANGLLVPKEIKRDLISRIERMDKVLEPADEQSFLEDLAAAKLGTRVTFEEAGRINELANEVQANESKKGNADFETRMEYGRSVVALQNYVTDLKKNAEKIHIADFKARPIATAAQVLGKIPGLTKAIQASMDNSAIFRQGWKTLWTHPGVWAKNAARSFHHLVKLRGQAEVLDNLNADIVSRPNYDLMKKARLDVGNLEEAFPTTLPEKVPVLGRIYKATENAYTAFLRKTRADVFDKYIAIAEKSGVDLTDNELKQIGRLVNSLTGRSDLGKLERAAGTVNNVFFSPKFLKSQFDVLTQPITGGSVKDALAGEGSNFVRKQAAINLVKIISAQAAILAIARAIAPHSVELDPTSSDFGKIKVGNTRFDVTGGMGSLAVLASRLATARSKSSTTGKTTDLANPKFGESSRLDVVENFLENKLSPIGSVIRDFLKGKTFDYKKPTVLGEAGQLVTPLPIKNAYEVLKDPTASNALRVTAILADFLGLSTNTYAPKASSSKLADLTYGKDNITNDTGDEQIYDPDLLPRIAEPSEAAVLAKPDPKVTELIRQFKRMYQQVNNEPTDTNVEKFDGFARQVWNKLSTSGTTQHQRQMLEGFAPEMATALKWTGTRQSENVIDMRGLQ